MPLPRLRFTVRRLMIAVALLTPLLLLFRAVDQASEAARRAQCTSNLKWIAVAMHHYHGPFESFPVGTIPNPDLPPEQRLSWAVQAWPWLSGGGTVLQVDTARGWRQFPNWPLTIGAAPGVTYVGMTPADTFNAAACPNDRASRDRVRPLPLTYAGIAGLGADAPTLPSGHPRAGIFGYDRATRIEDIKDGTSQTLLVVETSIDLAPWSAGGPSSVRGVDPASRPYFGRGRPFGGYHSGWVNVALADGSIRFIRDTVDPEVFEAMATIAGGETIPADW